MSINLNPSPHSYLHDLETIALNFSSDSASSKDKIKTLFQKKSDQLIGELISHPERSKRYREVGKRLKQLDSSFFRQIQTSIASIPSMAKLLTTGKEAKLDQFTRFLEKTKGFNAIYPGLVEDFHALKLPRDVCAISSISNKETRNHLLASLINRDSPSFKHLLLNKKIMMEIAPLVNSLGWQTFLSTFGGKLPDVSRNPEPLCFAIKQNLPYLVDFLLALHPAINLADRDGKTPLIHAISQNNPQLVRTLIAAGAVLPVGPEAVETLAQAGIHIDPQTPDSHHHILTALINLYQIPLKDIDLSNDDLMAIGPYLTTLDWKAVMRAFNGVLPNRKSPDLFSSPIKESKREVVKALIAIGADINPNVIGETPLVNAVKKRQYGIIEDLCAAGANVDARNLVGDPVLSEAIKTKDITSIEGLIKGGADVNNFDSQHQPLIFSAIRSGQVDIVQAFIRAGANVNAKNKEAEPVIFDALKQGSFDIIKALVTAGAHVNAPHPKEHSPLLFAMKEKRDSKIVRLLINSGADIPQYDSGTTLIEAAREYGFEALIPLIKKKCTVDERYENHRERSRFLAHIWGLGGKQVVMRTVNRGNLIKLEGNFLKPAIKGMTHYAKRFFVFLHKSKGLSTHKIRTLQNTVIGALENTFPHASLKQVHATLKAGNPCILGGGSVEHAIYSVIKGDRLFVCNRGEGRRQDATEVFELPEGLKNLELLKKLSREYRDTASFYKMLDGLQLRKVKGYAHKDQKIGNCSTANLKAALHVLFAETLGEEDGRKMYKQFTSFLRTESLNDYQDKYGSDSLVKRATRKRNLRLLKSQIKELNKNKRPIKQATFDDYIASAFSFFRSWVGAD